MEISIEFYVDNQGSLREGCATKTPREGCDFIKSRLEGIEGNEVTGLIGPSSKKSTMIVQTDFFGYLEIEWIIAPSDIFTKEFFIVECKLLEDCEVAQLNFNSNPADAIIEVIIREQIDVYEMDVRFITELDLTRWI